MRGRYRRTAGGHKYGAKRGSEDGYNFDSQKELRRYRELRILRDAGAIADLEIHPRFPIVIAGVPVKYPSGRTMEYRGDFKYREVETGRTVVEDVKGLRKSPRPPGAKKPRHQGTDTDASRIKRALVEVIYGLRVTVL